MPHNFKHGWKKKIQQTPVFIVRVRNCTSYVSYSKGGQSHLRWLPNLPWIHCKAIPFAALLSP